jgi:hypothetical protein
LYPAPVLIVDATDARSRGNRLRIAFDTWREDMASQTLSYRLRREAMRSEVIAVSDLAVRLGGALLAVAIATAHVADQGGLTAFTAPDWLGWAYRLIEVGGVLTAIALIVPRSARLGWFAGVLLGAGPFLGYVASRTVGVPGDAGDVGDWGDWVGTLALILEVGLVAVSVGMLRARWRRPPRASAPPGRTAEQDGAGKWSAPSPRKATQNGAAIPRGWNLLRPTSLN